MTMSNKVSSSERTDDVASVAYEVFNAARSFAS